MTPRIWLAGLGILVATQGCAAVGLAMLGTGLGIAAGQGTSYTLDGIAYRTFPESVGDLNRATVLALKSMDIDVKLNEETEKGRRIEAQAGDRDVYIDFERLTRRATRLRVTAKHGWIFRDRATAGEIIAQTERKLDELPTLSHKMR